MEEIHLVCFFFFFSIWYLSAWIFFLQSTQLQQFSLSYYVSCAWLKAQGFSVCALTKDYLLYLRVPFPSFSNVPYQCFLPENLVGRVSLCIWMRLRNQVIQGKGTELYVHLTNLKFLLESKIGYSSIFIRQVKLITTLKVKHLYLLPRILKGTKKKTEVGWLDHFISKENKIFSWLN